MERIGKILEKRQDERFTTYSTAVNTVINQEAGKRLMMLYAPNMQAKYCAFPERCVTGTAPRLKEIAAEYGNEFVQAWLIAQLCDFSAYCGCRDKLDSVQYKTMAAIIIRKYGWLKISEIMLFLFQCKAGEWGKFYGVIDTIQIMQALQKFAIQTRGEIIAESIRKEQAAALNNRGKDAVTYEEYLRMKESKK